MVKTFLGMLHRSREKTISEVFFRMVIRLKMKRPKIRTNGLGVVKHLYVKQTKNKRQ